VLLGYDQHLQLNRKHTSWLVYTLLCLYSVGKMPFVTASGIQVNFPFEPYPCQVTYMEKVITCLKEVSYFMK